MRRAQRGVLSELLPLALILASLACTFGLVVAMHKQAAATREVLPRPDTPPTVVIVNEDDPEVPDEPELPPPPPPAPVALEPPEDLTKPIVDGLAARQEKQERLAREANRKADELEAARLAAVADSERWQTREATVRGQIEALGGKAERLEHEADALAESRDVLAQEREASKAMLIKAKAKNGGYAVLPHKSPNGTWQRPIILECRDGKAFLQPRGIGFTMVDMSPYLDVRSPLVVGVASELMRTQRAGSPDGSAVVPYIYFVVRPDGIRPFYEARASLEKLGIAFGYELVDQDWDIDFPDLDNVVAWDGTASPRPKPGGGNSTTPNSFVWPAQRPGGVLGSGNGNGTSGGETPFIWPSGPRGELARNEGSGLRGSEGVGSRRRPGSPSSIGAGGPGGDLPTGLIPLDPGTLPGFDPSAADAGASPPLGRGGGFGSGSDRAFAGGGRPGDSGPSESEDASGPSEPTGGRPGYGTPRGRPGVVRPSAGDGRDRQGEPGALVPEGRVPIDPEAIARAVEGDDLDPTDRLPALPRNQSMIGRRGSDSAPLPPFAPGQANGSPTANNGEPNRSEPLPALPRNATGSVSPSRLLAAQPGGSRTETSGIGLPSIGGAKSSAGTDSESTTKDKPTDPIPPPRREPKPPETSVDAALLLTVACGPEGVIIHPGGYRLSLATLGKEGVLKTNLQTIVRNYEMLDPLVRPRPRLEFVIEPGGGSTYQLARKETVLSALGWPVTFRVSEASAARILTRERF